jgi:hypothetical protein
VKLSSSLPLLAVFSALASWAADPVPYAPIAMPLKDSGVDQRVRDSATLKIGRVRVNQAGYRRSDDSLGMAKFYYLQRSSTVTSFTVLDTTTHTVAGTGTLTDKGFKSSSSIEVKASNWAGLVSGGDTRYTMTSAGLGKTVASTETYEGVLPTNLVEGHYYRVAVGVDTSVAFLVGEATYGYVRDAVLKFFGINRSGDGPSWFHAPSHLMDGYLATPSSPGAYKGGWYDCGDHLKEPQTMGFALATLATLAATLPARDRDHYALNHAYTLQTDGIPDILAEAHFGAQFFLNSWLRHGKTTGPRGGTDTGMITGVGDFGKDHGWWGRPENQDAMTETGRGGYKERILRSELGANTLGDVAAGLAILSKRWRVYDAKFADSALAAAKDMYTYAKAHPIVVSSPAYNGSGPDKVNANLALAATALLWVTKDKSYLNDIAYDKTLGTHGSTFFTKYSFEGGWMAYSNPNLTKGGANTDWANRHALTLYAFYKLILADKDSALAYGVRDEAERQNLIAHTVSGVVQNLMDISGADGVNIPLPSMDPNKSGFVVKASSTWFVMYTQQEWVWNRYQVANAGELFFYYDISKDLEAGLGGTTFTQYTWNRDQIRQLIVRIMDYQLGDNPWDLSMLFGVGKKNFNHPHHRAANPEGRNTPGTAYQYHAPVGALYGAWSPDRTNDATAGGTPDWNEYHSAEVCLDGAAATLIPAVGLAADEPLNNPPHATVKVLDALDTTADIEVDLDKYGTVVLSWGTAQGAYTKTLRNDSAGVIFKFHLSGLSIGTQYFFLVKSTDVVGHDTTQDHWINPAPDGTPYNFTTLSQVQGPAQIANVKVCNVTADSAEIMWYTPNGQYQSSICWGTVPPVGSKTGGTTTCAMDTDVSGHATKFHYVKIGGLQERTTYYFKVASDGSDGAWDDNGGKDYKFTTPVKMANFSVYAVQYDWSGMPALAINVINNEPRPYDSLSLRVYVRAQDTVHNADGSVATHILSTPTGLVNVPMLFQDAIAARYDICQAYDGAGFNRPCDDPSWGLTWSWSTLNRAVQMLPPRKMPETYDSATKTSVYYFDLTLGPTMMQQGSRIRFDVIFAARSEYAKTLNQSQLDLINWAKSFIPSVPDYQVGDTGWFDALSTPMTQHPMGNNTQDWSWMPHSVALGAPVDFVGIPKVADQTAANAIIDNPSDNLPLDPYITVYRKGVFVYGFSPSAVEQSTKKTYWGIRTALDTPFNIPGATITLDKPSSLQYVTGTADIFDKLTPAAKGVVTDIWVNGVRLTPAQLATAAVKDPATGLWNLKIPVKLGVGGNDVDITIFGGGSYCPDTVVVCDGGCTFYDASYFIQFTKGKSTQSVLSLFDATGTAVGPIVVPDSSTAIVRVVDNDNNTNAHAPDRVKVVLTDLKTRRVDTLVLVETGDSTGVFQTALLPVAGTPASGKINVPAGDSVLVKYMDANDPEDSSQVVVYAKPVWPSLVSGAVVAGCGSALVRASLDRVFQATDSVLSGRVVVFAGTDSVVASNLLASQVSISGRSVVVSLGASLPDGVTAGRLDLVVRSAGGIVSATSAKLVDSAGPWIDSARVVENLTGNATDSVFFWASEPLATSAAWPFLATRSGVAVAAAAGATVSISDAPTRRYLLLLPAGSLRSGDSLRLDPASQSDLSGNAAVDCPSLAVRLGLIARAAPISRVWISDADGDGRADQIHVVFGKVVVAKDLPDSLQVRFGLRDTLRSAAISIAQVTDSVLVANLTRPFPFGLTVGSGVAGSGSMTVWKSGSAAAGPAVADSVGPVIVSAAIVYGTGAYDSLDVYFSEPVKTSGGVGWMILQPGTEVGISSIRPDSISPTEWKVPVVLGSVGPGDSVRVVATQKWAEARSGRKPPTAQAWVPVTGTVRPPAGLWIADSDGDGRADQVVLVFHKTVVAKDVPDSLQISFGLSDTLRSLPSSRATFSDSTIRFNLAIPYGYGVTRGSAANGAGVAVLFQAGQLNGPYALADSVGPVLLSAAIRYGDVGDTLDVQFSEPVAGGTGTGWLVEKPGVELGTSGDPVASSSTRWLLPVPSGSVAPGDSVRPLATEKWGEASTGRKPSAGHPWIAVRGSERAPAYGYYQDLDGDGAVDHAVLVFQKQPKSLPGLALLWPSLAAGLDSAVVDSGTWALDASGTTATIPVGPFAAGVTSSATTDLGRWRSNGEFRFPMFDSVPPVLLSATVRYASTDGVPDTLKVRWSEPLAAPLALVRHKPGGVEAPVSFQSPIQDPDLMGEALTLSPDSIQFRKGDSAALASLVVSDALGNVVPAATRWVPVTFGVRPVRVDYKLSSYMEIPTGSTGHSGSATQLWIRARGDQLWTFADSVSVPVLDTTQFVGLTISINRPMGGAVYLYDNAGVSVTSLDFNGVKVLADQGLLPTDAAGMYQLRISWDGRLPDGNWASSGVYVMRLVLKDDSEGGSGIINRVFKVGFKRPVK